MVEIQTLIATIYILYYSLIGVTIIALTSIIALFVVSPFSIIIIYRLSANLSNIILKNVVSVRKSTEKAWQKHTSYDKIITCKPPRSGN